MAERCNAVGFGCGFDPCVEINFGALKPLPTGYSVWWHSGHEHYQAHGPDEWESAITVRKYDARRWCFERASTARGA